MAKKNYISTKTFVIIILFVIGLVIGTYFFTSYMLTKSKAYIPGSDIKHFECKWRCTFDDNNVPNPDKKAVQECISKCPPFIPPGKTWKPNK